jgi:hypothetical protein
LERAMFRRFISAIIAVAGLGIMFSATGDSADPYKWCAVYSMFGGGRNCGFLTIEQCQATISGIWPVPGLVDTRLS